MLAGTRETFDQHFTGRWKQGPLLLAQKPIAHCERQLPPAAGLGQQGTDALGQMRRKWKFAALVGGDHRIGIARACYEGVGVLQPFEAQYLTRKGKGVADLELFDEMLLDL